MTQDPWKWRRYSQAEIRQALTLMFGSGNRSAAKIVASGRLFENQIYQVQIRKVSSAWGLIDHVMIWRRDEKPLHSWRDLQRIKNELLGPERIAIEVYPAAKDLVDNSHCYHLWGLPATMTLPFGL